MGRLLIAVTSVEQRGGYSTQALVAVGEGLSCFALWDLRRPGIEPVFPVLQGELLTTGLPGKLQIFFFLTLHIRDKFSINLPLLCLPASVQLLQIPQQGVCACVCGCVCVRVYVCVKSLQLCTTLCDPMDCSPPSSSVHGILQAGILEWVAMPSSRGLPVLNAVCLPDCLLVLSKPDMKDLIHAKYLKAWRKKKQ